MFRKSLVSLVTGLALVSLGAPAQAGDMSSLINCSNIPDDGKRLACMDRVAKTASLKRQTAAGGWKTNVEETADGKGHNVYLSLASEDVLVRSVQLTGKKKLLRLRPMMWLQCEDNVTSGYIDWGIFIDDGSRADIKSAFDNEPFRTAELAIAEGYKRTGTWQTKQAINFMKAAVGKNIFRVQITPYSEKPITAQFHIKGIEEAMKPLRQACSW